jgi:hypothetical protein
VIVVGGTLWASDQVPQAVNVLSAPNINRVRKM